MSEKIQPSGFTRSSSGESGGHNLYSRPSSGINVQALAGGLSIGAGNTLASSTTATDVVVTDDNITNATMYLVWTTGAGAAQQEFISSLDLSFNPATGVLSSLGFAGDFQGTSTTQAFGDNTTKLATDAFVQAAIAGAPFAFVWNEVAGPTTMLIDNGYVANNSSLVVLTLPPIAPFGAIVRVVNKGVGGWQIAQGAGQIIHFGNQNTTLGVGGSLNSQSNFDVVELLCTTANTNWTQLAAQGNITVI